MRVAPSTRAQGDPERRRRVAFLGDVMLGRLVNDFLKHAPPVLPFSKGRRPELGRGTEGYPWGDTLLILQSADARVCNLECVISDRGQPWSATEKVFHFRTDAKNIEVLTKANINAVSLANNHTLDFEYEAMFDMLNILQGSGIAHAGAGKNIDEAMKPTVFNVGDARLGMISLTDNEPSWEATKDKPGIFYVPIDVNDRRSQNLFSLIHTIKSHIPLLIVAAHWGPNWSYVPPPEHIPFAHALIDAGADIIFGHSAHIFRGIELYKNKPILYSTGDFIDDYAVDEIERNDQSFIFTVEFEHERIANIKLYPTVIRDFQAQLAGGSEARMIAEKMEQLCAAFGTRAQWNSQDRSLEVMINQ